MTYLLHRSHRRTSANTKFVITVLRQLWSRDLDGGQSAHRRQVKPTEALNRRSSHKHSLRNADVAAVGPALPTILPGRWRWCDRPWLCDVRESKTRFTR